MVVNLASPLASVTWYPRRNFLPTVLNPGSATSEYTPWASQCHTSTAAPARGVHPSLETFETRKTTSSGSPSATDPSDGSERMSDRMSISSTKYGPSVSSGRTTHAGVRMTVVNPASEVAVEPPASTPVALGPSATAVAATSSLGAHATSSAAPAVPNSARTSLRLRTLPTGRSSLSISLPSIGRPGLGWRRFPSSPRAWDALRIPGPSRFGPQNLCRDCVDRCARGSTAGGRSREDNEARPGRRSGPAPGSAADGLNLKRGASLAQACLGKTRPDRFNLRWGAL